MTSEKEGRSRQKRSSGSRSYKVYRLEISKAAEKTIKSLRDKDLLTVKEVLRIVAADPFNPTYTTKLRGEWEGLRRAKKGNWRVIYYPPEGETVKVVYIRSRDDRTYRK